MARTARAAASQTMVGAKYLDRFDTGHIHSKFYGRRILTKGVKEYFEPLSQEDAMGHRLYIAGLHPNQYIWCEACNSYTGVRAQKLLRTCTRVRHPSQAISRLRCGNNPDDGTPLATLPRRVTRRDVGTDVWCGTNDGASISQDDPDCVSDSMGTLEHACVDHSRVMCHSNMTHPSSVHHWVDAYEEDDPLDLGNNLG